MEKEVNTDSGWTQPLGPTDASTYWKKGQIGPKTWDLGHRFLSPWSKYESESHSVVSDSLQSHELYSPWNSPGQNTRVGSLSFLHGIFQTQRLNPGLPYCRWILYQLSHKGSPSILLSPSVLTFNTFFYRALLPYFFSFWLYWDIVDIQHCVHLRCTAYWFDLHHEMYDLHHTYLLTSWIFIGWTDAKAEAPILWPPDGKSWLIGKDPDAGKDWRQEEKGTAEDEMVGWHHWLMDMSLSKLWELEIDRKAWCAAVHEGHKKSDKTEWLNNNITKW